MAKPIRYIKVNGIKKPIYAEDENGNPICGRKRKDGTICLRPAGDGTDHPGYGRCEDHHGNTKGSFGVAKTTTHGMFMSGAIWRDLLDPYIIEHWDNMRTDTLEQVQNEIKLCDARLYYLLGKIKELQDKSGFVCVESKKDDFREIPVDTVIINYYKAIDAVQARKIEILKVKAKLEDSDPELGNIDNMMSLVKTLNASKSKILKFKEAREDEVDED